MNREQKAAVIEEIAANIRESDAVFAVDYRGLSVPQIGELRTRLRAADARFTVVKNTLTERAADAADAESLKELLEGPTALTFVRGDAAAAAKALRDYARETDLVPFKGGLMDGNALTPEDIGAIARLPSPRRAVPAARRRRRAPDLRPRPDPERAHRRPGHRARPDPGEGPGRAATRPPEAPAAEEPAAEEPAAEAARPTDAPRSPPPRRQRLKRAAEEPAAEETPTSEEEN